MCNHHRGSLGEVPLSEPDGAMGGRGGRHTALHSEGAPGPIRGRHYGNVKTTLSRPSRPSSGFIGSTGPSGAFHPDAAQLWRPQRPESVPRGTAGLEGPGTWAVMCSVTTRHRRFYKTKFNVQHTLTM